VKRAVALFFGCGLWLLAGPAHAADGTVTAVTGSECSDYFVVNTDDGYALLEWYSGPMPETDDKVAGDFDRFSAEEISVLPAGNRMRVYVEDYGLSKDDAADKLKEKCD
jgi:hypothetical protein